MANALPIVCEIGPNSKKRTGTPDPAPEVLGRRGLTWQLILDEHEFRLLDHEGREVAAVPREGAESAFRFPSIWDTSEVHNLGIVTPGETYWFQPDPASIGPIRAYLDEALVRLGPEALDAYRRWARKQFLIGLMGLIGGPLAAYYGWHFFAFRHMPHKFYALLLVIAFTGIMQFFRGCRAILRLRRLRGLEEESWWA